MGCMQCTWWVVLAILSLLAAAVLQHMITSGVFEHVYNHRPGKCWKFEMPGSEDIALLPSKQALISSGLYSWYGEGSVPKPEPAIFMFDMKNPSAGPKKLAFEGNFLDENDVVPHGISHWIKEDGTILLYVVNHRRGKDTIECFEYVPEMLSLKHVQTFEDPLIYNINDLVVVGPDEFYATNDRHCSMFTAVIFETILRLPLSYVLHYKSNSESKIVVNKGLAHANGIARSNDSSVIYVSSGLGGEVIAYKRNKDNSLTPLQTLPLQLAIDNLFVDPNTGHLWAAILPKPDVFYDYLYNQSVPFPGRILHIALDENAGQPFDGCKIEEVFSTTGEEFGATTVGVYHDGGLLIGTIAKDMMYCEVPYLMY